MRKIVILIPLFAYSCAQAFFEKSDFSARPSGMACAFSAVAADLNAITYNPAGLALMPYPQINLSYSKPYQNLDDGASFSDNAFSAGMPLKLDSKNANQTQIDFGSIGILYRDFKAGSNYGERTISIAYAREAFKNFYAGFKYNIFKADFDPGIYGLNAVDLNGEVTQSPDLLLPSKSAGTASTVDLGVYYRLDSKKGENKRSSYCFSMFKTNVVSSGIDFGESGESAPAKNVFGFGYYHRLFKIDIDYTRMEVSNSIRDSIYAAGIERWFSINDYGRAAIRSGLSLASKGSNTFAMGLSYLFKHYIIDYAFVMPVSGYEDMGPGHKVTFTVRFGDVGFDLEPNTALMQKSEQRRKLDKNIRDIRAEINKKTAEAKKLQYELRSAKSGRENITGSKGGSKAGGDASFVSGMNLYRAMVSEQRSFTDRQTYLEGLVNSYKGTGADIAQAHQELDKVNRVIENGKSNLELNWSYYQKIVERGADIRERKRVLLEIKRKFAYIGIDLSRVENELAKVEKEMYR